MSKLRRRKNWIGEYRTLPRDPSGVIRIQNRVLHREDAGHRVVNPVLSLIIRNVWHGFQCSTPLGITFLIRKWEWFYNSQGPCSSMTKTLGGHADPYIPLRGVLTPPWWPTLGRAPTPYYWESKQSLGTLLLFSQSKCFSLERSHFTEEKYSMLDKPYISPWLSKWARSKQWLDIPCTKKCLSARYKLEKSLPSNFSLKFHQLWEWHLKLKKKTIAEAIRMVQTRSYLSSLLSVEQFITFIEMTPKETYKN